MASTGAVIEAFLNRYFDDHERRRYHMTDVHFHVEGSEVIMTKGLGQRINVARFDIAPDLARYEYARVMEDIVTWAKKTALSWVTDRERWLAAEETRPRGWRPFGRRAQR